MPDAIATNPASELSTDDDTRHEDARQSERGVIGALLLAGGTAQREILDIVEDQDFCDPFCAWVIVQMRRMVGTGHPMDMVTFPAWVERHGLTPLARTRRTIRTEFYDATRDCPTPNHGAWYAAQVVEQSARRRVLDAGTRIAGMAYADDLGAVRHQLVIEYTDALIALDRAQKIMD